MRTIPHAPLLCAPVTCLALLCAASAPVAAQETTEQAPPKRVLIVTGEDYPGHPWHETAPVLWAQLIQHPRLSVDLTDSLAVLGSERLGDYDAVFLHFKNYDPAVPGREAFDDLRRYVEGGGGLALSHFACGAFEEFRDDFAPLAGRVWFGEAPPEDRHQHDPYGPFTVDIAAQEHSVTRGMEPFETTDELYTCLEGEAPIEVVATATSVVDGKTYPMAFVLDYGEGRVFHCVLGHNAASLSVPQVGELFRRGVAWAAGLTGE